MSSICLVNKTTVCCSSKPLVGVPSLRRTATSAGNVEFVKAGRRTSSTRSQSALHAVNVVEIAQLAEADAGLIWGTAAISFACVLVGIAVGFVLLRAESLVEDGTIKL